MRKSVVILALVLASVAPFFASAYEYPGNATGYVNDFAHVLTAEEVTTLESTLQRYEASTSNEIAVVTLVSLQGDTVENYAVKLFEDWKIGKADRDNGILLLVARDDRQVRVEVGYGLEGAVPDATSYQIIQKEILPKFRNGDFAGGISAGVDRLMQASRGEYSVDTPSVVSTFVEKNMQFLLFGAFMLFSWLGAILGRSKSWWLGGVIGALGGLGVWKWFAFSLLTGGALTGVLVVCGLFFDYVVSNSYRGSISRGTSVPWWSGGGGLGGGGFGGFGGGSSGGGGASGRW